LHSDSEQGNIKKFYLITDMANHKSALKRIRANEAKRLRNRYQAKTTRTFIKRLKASTDKVEASELYKKVVSMLDKLAKKNVIHKNNASNKKSRLAKVVAAIA
jgi:small subunit ribosomal protein S20